MDEFINQIIENLINEKLDMLLNKKIDELFKEKTDEYQKLIEQPHITTITIQELMYMFDKTEQCIYNWRKKFNLIDLNEKTENRTVIFDKKQTLEILLNNGKKQKKNF